MKAKGLSISPGAGLSPLIEWAAPKLTILPTLLASLVFVYGFILWTGYISFTDSKLLPSYEWAGPAQYVKLYDNDRWWVASANLGIFGSLFILFCLALGILLAVLLDQRVRNEGLFRTIYLYPMALSFIVAGTAWQWILRPGLGIEKLVRDLGFETFTFDWLVDPDMAIYTVVIAGVWQSTGFVMALFLAGFRSIDENIIKAARVDGATLPRIYLRIVIPSLRPVFFSAVVILAHIAIKSFDLVVALTRGGPGYASDLPATFMYAYAFNRNQLALGAASAMLMLVAILFLIVPYIYSELKGRANA